MRIGILTNIHEEVETLRTALPALAAAGANTVVQIGDACDRYGPGGRTAEVAAAGVRGAWGNHDVGLSFEESDRVRERADPRALDYMTTMLPRLDLGGCHFAHVDPYLDPCKPEDLWSAYEPPLTAVRFAPSFAGLPHAVLFIGHYHR